MSDTWKWVDIRWSGDDDFIRFERHNIEDMWGNEVYEAIENMRIVVDKSLERIL